MTSASTSGSLFSSPGAVVPGVGEVQMELRKEQTSWGNSEISPPGSEPPRFWVSQTFQTKINFAEMGFTEQKNTTMSHVRYKNNRHMYYLNVFDVCIYIWTLYTYILYISYYYMIFHLFDTLYLQNWLNLFNFFLGRDIHFSSSRLIRSRSAFFPWMISAGTLRPPPLQGKKSKQA